MDLHYTASLTDLIYISESDFYNLLTVGLPLLCLVREYTYVLPCHFSAKCSHPQIESQLLNARKTSSNPPSSAASFHMTSVFKNSQSG